MNDQVTTPTPTPPADKPPATPPAETPPATPPAEPPKPSDSLADKPPDSLVDRPPDVPAPIEYKDFTVPEGFELDPEGLKGAQGLFSELRIPQEGAQRLIDLFAENAVTIAKSVEEDATEEWQKLRGEWTKTIETDPDVGGAKLPESRAQVSKLFDAFGTPGLRDALKLTGADNNPEVFKMFVKVASALTESGKFRSSTAPTPGPKTLAQRMYPEGPNTTLQGKVKEEV